MLDHRRRTTRRTALFADTSEDDSPRRIPYYSLSRFVLLSPPSFSLSLFLSLSYSPRRFHGATIPIPDVPSRVPGEGSSDYGQRVSTADQRGFIGGTGPGCSTPTNPFLDQQPIHSRSIDIFVHFETVLSFLLL